jgi:hypothetical protein
MPEEAFKTFVSNEWLKLDNGWAMSTVELSSPSRTELGSNLHDGGKNDQYTNHRSPTHILRRTLSAGPSLLNGPNSFA